MKTYRVKYLLDGVVREDTFTTERADFKILKDGRGYIRSEKVQKVYAHVETITEEDTTNV